MTVFFFWRNAMHGTIQFETPRKDGWIGVATLNNQPEQTNETKRNETLCEQTNFMMWCS